MAFPNLFVTLIVIAAILLPTKTIAMEYIVGDDRGGSGDSDYQDWAKDKEFKVGDVLVFKYKPPNHNVFKVDGDAFKDCDVPEDAAPLTTGTDRVVLQTPGRKWYLCGERGHCDNGQKLSITVN